MKRSENGFAVSTILVVSLIFGSIGFISLQGYSSDARNSKRTSDIGSLQSAISTQLAQGQSIMSFVSDNKDNRIDASVLSIGGRKETSTDYSAGSVNYAALPVKKDDFQDPIGKSYVIGVTNRVDGKYELAATLEQGGTDRIAKVVGNYNSRNVKEATCSIKVGTNNYGVSITSNFINYFHTGDHVNIKTDNGNIKTKIIRISSDGSFFTLADAVINPTIIALRESESKGLIDQKDDDGKSGVNFVENGGYNLPY